MNPRLTAVLARLCERLGPLFSTQAVKLPYLVDVVAQHALGRKIAEGTYETWEHGVVTREIFRFIKRQSTSDAVFRVEAHHYSESGKLISLARDPGITAALTPEEIAIVDLVAGEYGHIPPEQLGFLTKRLNTEKPPEAWGTNAAARVDEDAFLCLSQEWQELCQSISEADLDDRSQWSEPINSDPASFFMRALNG